MKSFTELSLAPPAKRSFDICRSGFRSLLDAVDANDVAGQAARNSTADLFVAQSKYLDAAFLGPFLRGLKERTLTLRNARLLDVTLKYLESRIGAPMNPLHETYLKLLAWENFIEIPAPLILAGNCLQALRPPATFDFDFFEKQKGRPLFGGPAKLRFVRKLAEEIEAERPGVVPAAVVDMLAEMDSILVEWLRHSVAHCFYLLELDPRKVSARTTDRQGKTVENSATFEGVWELYQRAFGYLEGFRQAVDDFALESSGVTYKPNWGPNY